jgi:hypothetical protein
VLCKKCIKVCSCHFQTPSDCNRFASRQGVGSSGDQLPASGTLQKRIPHVKVSIACSGQLTHDTTCELTPGALVFEDDHLVYPDAKKIGRDPSVDVGHKYESSVHGKIASSPGYKPRLSRSTITRSP